MPTQKPKSRTQSRSTKGGEKKPRASAKATRRRTGTKPLAVADAVLREPVKAAPILNPMTVLEPLRQRMVDHQIAWFGMVMAFSPAHVIANQQAAFWKGVVGTGNADVSRRSAKPSRAAQRASKRA